MFGMFGGLFICICRSVCWDNVIVRRVFFIVGVFFLRGLFRVSVIIGGFFGGFLKPLQFGEFAMF